MANSLSTRHRNSVYFFSFLLLALAASCSAGDMANDDPTSYVDALMQSFRAGTVSSLTCPNVQWMHISRLLEYGQSTEIVSNDAIPANPTSSCHMRECSEGIFALWMVEAARIHTLNHNSKEFGMGWPSQNPIIQRMNGSNQQPTWYVNDPAVQQEVLAAYVSWWNDAKGKKSAASKDPLEKTIYMWH